MQVLKAVAPNGDTLTFNIPTEATEVTVGQFFECHIAYHAMMGALRHQAETGENSLGGVPLVAYLNALAHSLRPFMPGVNPTEVTLAGESEEHAATMLMGAVEAIAGCFARHTPKTPENVFEFDGQRWYLCEQAVNYKNQRGPGFSVKQVAQSLLLEDYFKNFLEFKLAKDVEAVIESRDAEQMSAIYMTPTRIFLAQLALFLRKSPDEPLPQTQEAFDRWHSERIKEIEQLPLAVAIDVRNFFFLTSMPSQTTPSSATGSSPQGPPASKKAPTKSKSGSTEKGTKTAKAGNSRSTGDSGKPGPSETGT
jgi:hypothetical protein